MRLATRAISTNTLTDTTPDVDDTRQSRACNVEGIADLEAAADLLLESAGALGRETGIYTERQLRRKSRTEMAQAPHVDECAIPDEVIAFLVHRQVEELIDVSRLTVRQELVYRLHAGRMGIKCIAATLKIGRQTAARSLRVAKRRVRAAYQEGRYAGWYEVYLSEVERHRTR